MENGPPGTCSISIDGSLYEGETSCIKANSNKFMYIHKQKYGQIFSALGICLVI